MGGDVGGDACNHQETHTGVDPDQGRVADGRSSHRGTWGAPAAETALAEESIIMALEQEGLYLAHRVQSHTDNDKKSGSTEELCCHVGNIQRTAEKLRKDRNDHQEDRAGKCEATHGVVEEISRRLAGTDSGNETTVLLEIVGDLGRTSKSL